MCAKAVDDFLPPLMFVLDWFVTIKMIKKLDDAFFATDDITLINEGSNNVTSFCGEMGILSVDVDKINLDFNFDENHPETIIYVRLMVWCN